MRCTCFLLRAAVSVALSLGSMAAFGAPGQHKPAPEAPGPAAGGKGIADPSQTIAISATTDVVNKNVTVDASLLPYSVSRRIFGTEIAKHYAVIQLVISNHDSGDAMIVQSVFLDYSQWLFSGTFAALGPSLKQADGLGPQQTSNSPFQVSSTESRLVRAELQDAQQWTARNWTVRSAVLIGATAVAYQFPFGQAFAQGSNAFSGVMVPGLQAMWPDNVQAQINHISDFGFGTNHVIPKNSSDVVVAFFPLDRFLTPELQEIFRKAPSAYFNPSEMLIDKTYQVKLLNLLRMAGALETDVSPEKVKKQGTNDQTNNKGDAKIVTTAIQHYEQFRLAHAFTLPGVDRAEANGQRARDLAQACGVVLSPPSNAAPTLTPKDCLLLTLLNAVSLNNIRVVASGIMAVDTSRIPATLTAVELASDANKPETWAVTTKAQTATLVGTFLSGAQPVVTATKDGTAVTGPVFETLTVDALRSDDNRLVFTYTVPAKIDAKTQLLISVVKKSKDGSQAQSAPLLYAVPAYVDAAADGKPNATPGAAAQQATTPAAGAQATPGGAAQPAAAANPPSASAPAAGAVPAKAKNRRKPPRAQGARTPPAVH